MELIRGRHNLRPHHHGCVATIGNFDGVHLGHQAVLGQLAEKAAELCLPTTVITFEPQPQEYFDDAKIPPRLTRLREKLRALQRYSVNRVLCLPFNRALAQMEAEDFIQQVLIEGLGVRYLVVGDDFCFGKGRRGDFAMLQRAGAEHGFEVVHMHTYEVNGGRVSSTRIREALQAGNLSLAEQLLGRPYRMSGRVAHGNKLGRTIGFPTANIFLHRKKTPVEGVFAVEMFGIEGEPVPGVANVGTRPTVGGTRALLEVHLFDFEGEIYGRHVHVDFLHRIREERRFESFDALKAQILRDAEEAKEFFTARA
ncbi:MAG: bifunctional riboflavin kinase/FAD synthetase [Gammaproteobacteria bacterium]|nr:bifunctional riboflavin kinase/FAD synthetase [Gammaproteobacteria bacterium]MCW8841084.1 bifunctional riboflavin kinase/FAD synthetase [Gammaproteobacteria bacterium]MCW8927330.1 bifunctional riboflavin kinase/FAD synthetase [Gammaproteobacteria bacterium]MCW8957875.1 bifunctional riboflavin kinase/FAD synthetase [Gammaproteobacteria bacterium]MCW8973759.1 bifunctional riboflavin kinase/FAD synthetase [Gammaproteobacteria bacterium]